MEAPSYLADCLSDAALACLQSGGDIHSVTKFVDILNAPFKKAERGTEWQLECEGILKQARVLIDPSLSSGKELLDYVGAELLNVAVPYVGVSKPCQESSTLLIQDLAAAFDPPREMFTAFFEAINMYSTPQTLHICLPLLRGLSMVFPRIRRRKAEFFKEAVPGLLEVGRSAGQDEGDISSDDHNEDFNDNSIFPNRLALPRDYLEDNIQYKLIEELVHVAKVIKGICDADQEMQTLRDILGIFTLQLLAIVCGAISDSDMALPDMITELMELLSFCNLSLSTLVSTTKVDKILVLNEEDETKAQENNLDLKRGAAIAVCWWIQREESDSATNMLDVLKQNSQAQGSQAVLDVIILASNLLVHVACKQEMSLWQKGVNFMDSVVQMYCSSASSNDACQMEDALEIYIQIMPALQRLQNVLVYTYNPMVRRQAYGVLMKIITQVVPTTARFVTLHGLISNCYHPSLVSLLLTCTKDEVLKAWPLRERQQKLGTDGVLLTGLAVNVGSSQSPFTSREVLQLIQCALQTRSGELIELPTYSDVVVGALNLYRFLLIRESSGKTNYTGVLSKEELVKARTFWLLPLREQVLRVRALSDKSDMEIDLDVTLGMDCLQSLIYRCLEIVEQLLANLPE